MLLLELKDCYNSDKMLESPRDADPPIPTSIIIRESDAPERKSSSPKGLLVNTGNSIFNY